MDDTMEDAIGKFKASPSNAELSRRLDDLEGKYDRKFRVVFDAIRQMMSPPHRDRKQIGFRPRR